MLEIINDNAYKIDLSSKYNMSSTFNVSDLSPFIAGDEALEGMMRTSKPKGHAQQDWNIKIK